MSAAVNQDSFPSVEAWYAEAERRFGPDTLEWRFVCPSCGRVTAVKEWREAGAPEGAIAFSCVGRWAPKGVPVGTFGEKGKAGGCDYIGGGLFKINPVRVEGAGDAFAFAEGGAV